MSIEDGKKRGRPQVYHENHPGAPKVTTRLSPDLHAYLTSRPEGVRPYLEALLRKDKEANEAEDDMFIYNMMRVVVRPKSPPVTNPDKYHLVQPPEVADA